MTGSEIIQLLGRRGPMTGAQLVEATGLEVFALWNACRKLPEINFEPTGARFLRLDRAVGGFARLSPSIRREFLTYTLLGLNNQREQLESASQVLRNEIREISQAKLELARESMASAVEALEEHDLILRRACFIIAGDVVYSMSHTVPRPEKSTGEMVRGSDLDIVVVVEDDLPQELFKALDRGIHRKKHYLLMHPGFREEIDYIIKNLGKVRDQVRFDSFEAMVACKILREGRLLCGSEAVFAKIKGLLDEHGIHSKLDEMERRALAGRESAERRLLELPADSIDSESVHLFYTREEGEEIY